MRTLSIMAVAALLLIASCKRRPVTTGCETVLCTAVFVGMIVQVMDTAGQPVVLDEAYTVRVSTNERITYDQTRAAGTYTVLDDSYRSKLFNTRANFRFIGKKNGMVVVDEAYTISADCCHVKKESGTETVIVN